MGATVMLDVPEQQSLAFLRPTRQPRPPDDYTRVDGCGGAAFETISRSLLVCGDANRALELLPASSAPVRRQRTTSSVACIGVDAPLVVPAMILHRSRSEKTHG